MESNVHKKKSFPLISIIRTVIQILSFLLMPGLFVTIFSSIGAIYTSLLQGSFDLSEQVWHIVLVAATFLVTFIWGRFFCGYVCSFGAMQDLLWFGGKHLPHTIKISEKADKLLKLLKYAVLLFMFLGVWTFSVTGTTLWSPWTIFGMYASLSRGVPSGTYLVSVGGGLMLLILIGSFFIDRFFCKYLCPLGALFSFASRFRIFRIKKSSSACGNCRLCSTRCPMSIPMNQYDTIRSGECINCQRCVTVCHRDNVRADISPAVSGTIAATALMGVCFAGTIPPAAPSVSSPSSVEVSQSENTGAFKDGTYTGTGSGFRGNISLTVTVSGGNITDIAVLSNQEDQEFFFKAKNSLIPSILASQSVQVNTVSGATFSSRGIIEAVQNALGDQLLLKESSESLPSSSDESSRAEGTLPQKTRKKRSETQTASTPESDPTTRESTQESTPDSPSSAESATPSETEESTVPSAPDNTSTGSTSDSSSSSEEISRTEGTLPDGVYTGTGTGYRGETAVRVTVSGGSITDITITSYQDDGQFFHRAASGIISSVIEGQTTQVDTVSGATFSSNGLIEAISNALGIDFTNPNHTMTRKGHGR